MKSVSEKNPFGMLVVVLRSDGCLKYTMEEFFFSIELDRRTRGAKEKNTRVKAYINTSVEEISFYIFCFSFAFSRFSLLEENDDVLSNDFIW